LPILNDTQTLVNKRIVDDIAEWKLWPPECGNVCLRRQLMQPVRKSSECSKKLEGLITSSVRIAKQQKNFRFSGQPIFECLEKLRIRGGFKDHAAPLLLEMVNVELRESLARLPSTYH
jgi:hypothetical protein